MKTKLVIVEGLPGSGKSTAAQMVYEILNDQGINSELFSEGNYNHPADYDGVAYFDDAGFSLLKQSFPAYKDVLDRIKEECADGYIIPYKKSLKENLMSFEDDLFQAIIKNDIYELPLELHIKLILNRWRIFVREYEAQDKLVIFECCFIQNPVTVSMIRSNSEKHTTMSYVNELAEIISPLNPILIYIDQKDIKASFSKAVEERPKEWLEGFTQYYTNQGFGLANNLNGPEGVLQVLKARNELEQEIFDSLKLTKYKLDNSSFNFNLLRNELNSILKAHI